MIQKLDKVKELTKEMKLYNSSSCISEDEEGFPILMEEVELAIQEIKNGKETGVG